MPEKSLKTKEKTKTPVSRAVVMSKERNPLKLGEKSAKDRELYLQWVSMPAMVRMLPLPELEKMGYDVEDPVFLKMYSIKRKGEFCREFKISVNMPAKWEAEANFVEEVNSLSSRSYIMKHRKDVDFSFTQKVIRHGDASRVKLWKQLNEGWSERTEAVNVNLNMTPADLVREIEERNRRIRGES